MDLQAFFMERVEKPSEEEVIVSGRFPAFRLRGISEEENGQIRAGCRRKDGGIDPERYLMRLTAACVAEPELSGTFSRTPFETLEQFIYDGDDRNIKARYCAGELLDEGILEK